jgi:hypothetical protein
MLQKEPERAFLPVLLKVMITIRGNVGFEDKVLYGQPPSSPPAALRPAPVRGFGFVDSENVLGGT